ncbi:serine hydrolase domain-containing protein [Polaribacter glomeratus]|nr:serine hydrolase domain-containing protein [Polaribacter glomeratus]
MKKIVLSFLLLSFSICSFSQFTQSAAIDSIFVEWNKADTPGCALGIIKNNELIYTKGYGLANMEYDIPNSASSVFRIGSTSKQFTAACIILLAEKGKLSLDDNLKSLFSDFPAYAEKITIKHLLNHTSGIRDYLQISYLKGMGGDDFYTDDHVMQWLINQSDLNFAPGEEYLYSNSGYWLLGQIVKKVAGINMADFAKKELFEPLKMMDTHFHNDHTKIVKNRASGYVPDTNDGYKISMTTLDMIGDGGIFTTINDIKKWDDSFYKSDVLSENFWTLMTQQGILNNGEVIEYAAGLIIEKYKGLKTIRHGGAFVGFRAEIVRFPDQKLSIAIFANRGDANPSDMADQVADILLKDKFLKEVVTKEKKIEIEIPKVEFTLNQIVGNYEIEPGYVATLTIKNDSLNVIQNWNTSTYNIVKIATNRFKILGSKNLIFTFLNLKDGFTQTMKVLQGDTETIAKRKKEIDISAINLKNYIGSYFSKELNVTYNFELENEILSIRIEDKTSTIKCIISDLDQFSTQLGLLRFYSKKGLISGFELDSGRVKNLKFQKK